MYRMAIARSFPDPYRRVNVSSLRPHEPPGDFSDLEERDHVESGDRAGAAIVRSGGPVGPLGGNHDREAFGRSQNDPMNPGGLVDLQDGTALPIPGMERMGNRRGSQIGAQ